MNNPSLFPTDQRGVALPMAMLALLILSILVIGFSVLSATEPTVANNQLMVTQARALAEAGIERAIWALNNPTNENGIPTSVPLAVSWTAPTAYSGGQLISVSTGSANIGGFRVTVASKDTSPYPSECAKPAASMSAAELCIVAVGWVPDDTSSRAHQKIAAIVFNPKFLFKDPPAALSVRGELQAGGNSLIDSRSDTSCGAKDGTITTGETSMNGNATDIYGADGNNIDNQVYNANGAAIPSTASDIVKNVSTQSFDNYIWTDNDINALRLYAKANGTYLQGTVTFDAGNLIPNGVVFIDTVSGNNIAQEGVTPVTPSSDLANVAIHGNPPADPSGIFSGILFVNGSLSIDGNFKAHGMVYAQNDISYHGIGTGGVWGAMLSRNIKDLSSTSIDSDLLGNALINYNCAYAKCGGGTLDPNGKCLGPLADKWSVVKGTYREPCDSGSCS